MRAVYKIVMGLMLFNAFLVVFAPFFSSESLEGDAISSSDMEAYDPYKGGWGTLLVNMFTSGETWSGVIGGAVTAVITLGVALLTKNYVFIGVGLFLGLVIGLYIQVSSVLYKIIVPFSDQYGIIQGILAVTGIAIGLLILFNVVDMFAPSPTR